MIEVVGGPTVGVTSRIRDAAILVHEVRTDCGGGVSRPVVRDVDLELSIVLGKKRADGLRDETLTVVRRQPDAYQWPADRKYLVS